MMCLLLRLRSLRGQRGRQALLPVSQESTRYRRVGACESFSPSTLYSTNLRTEVFFENRRILDSWIRRSQCYGLFEGGGRLIVLAQLVEAEAQVILGFRRLRIGLERFLKTIGRDIHVALLVLAHPFVIVRLTRRPDRRHERPVRHWGSRSRASLCRGPKGLLRITRHGGDGKTRKNDTQCQRYLFHNTPPIRHG